ncbi:piezo-type mechanosensitive ion channel component isoform X1 [Schistocerca gregaria]|uniref:piezo-type mechanosensitive ion channel component isoform X1 n=1 Tax=Schistocerca gregaria TaxID=7010 RepID=UPI00211E4375|nr:piezo-type mechanosensitive ion channel component isoform X1 [Schistocerca gregaria]
MTQYLLSFTLIRLVLPICLSACVLFRQNLFSFLYFLLFLFSPWVKVPTYNSMKGATGIYLQIVIFCSVITCLAHLAFQLVLLSMPPYGYFLENCGMLEKILRHVGLVRLNDLSISNGIRILGPDILMLSCSLSVYIICKRLNAQRRDTVAPEHEPSSTIILPKASRTLRRKRYRFFVIIGKYITLLSLGIAGVIQPSVLNGIYFITFLGSMTWWACYRDLRRAFSVVLHIIVLIAAVHITAIFCMQLQYIQEIVTDKCNVCRYLGLKSLVYTNCLDPGDTWYIDADWTNFLNPAVLFWLYYVLSLEARLLFMPHEVSLESNEYSVISGSRTQISRPEVEIEDDESVGFRENTPLIRGVSPTVKYHSTVHNAEVVGASNMFQDPHGSVTITDGREDAIQLQPIGENEGEELRSSAFEIILDCITLTIQLINRSSYIGANLIMMAWSITHHSWLTFVLLLWASLLWMFPNQRRAMLRSSPFLVFYAELLLIAQYIYGMDLNDSELPQEVKGVNLKQIGFEKPDGLACEPLLIKIAYTVMFWITLRQYMQEKFEQRSTSALHDLAAPLQVTVNTATSGFGNQNETNKTYGCLEPVFKYVKMIMVKYFIWVVAIMLFAIGITGKRMTLFRIIYMALFLVFVLVFQLSYRMWRRMMFGFWLTVIVYSMSILILVYTYQFDNFSEYWAKYLHIPLTLQLDIGLERFDTTQLFTRLLTPTAFLVMTVIQLHYFHKEFLEISDIRARAATLNSARTSRSGDASGRDISLREEDTDESSRPDDTNVRGTSFYRLQQLGMKGKHLIEKVSDFMWLFLEMHILKILLLSIMLLGAYDVCALHFILVLLAVISLSFGTKFQTIVAHICSVGVSCLILAKMIYQIEYIEHDLNDVNCTDTTPRNGTVPPGEESNFTANDMDWVGFHKSSEDFSLPELLKGYIGLILVATFRAVINIRQKYVRHLRGFSTLRPTVMFPNIRRADADKDLKSFVKYLFNYGFYKLGLEACLMATVGLIGTRLDFYAVLYSFWLCLLFAMRRETAARIWIFYQIFIAVLLPVQYALAVGLPPGLCLSYPWYNSVLLRRLQDWMFLPDPLHSPPAYKLVCDFVLLMLVCRQSVVFHIERQNTDVEFPGGTNKDITTEVEDPNFVNPVPDHISYVRSWLDILKRGVLRGFLWTSLAVVFLTGTNRVNVFSLGYLCGSFIFLWQGEDFYLRPIKMVVRWWNTLLGYNVAVIVIKAILQIPGCIFAEYFQTNACWAVQLFSIGCIKRFGNSLETSDLTDAPECHVPKEDVGIAWDGVCFGFLILMRRIFCSYYFVHLVNETKAMTVLASRGAELIEELRQKRIREQQEQEHQILEKIKRKMERIKATQQKVQGALKEPTNHFAEGELGRQRSRALSKRAAIRSGDYYMFEEFDDEDILDADKDESDDFDHQFDTDKRRATLGEILSAAMKTDVEQAADMALSIKPSEESSSALPRKKSSFFSAQSHVSPDQPPTAHQPGPSVPEEQPESEAPGTQRSVEGKDTTDGQEAALGEEKEMKTEGLDEHRSPASSRRSSQTSKKQSLGRTVWTYIKFAWALIEGSMETLVRYLNRFSRDYRYVIRVLALEKKLLKEDPTFGKGVRTGAGMIWQPLPSGHERQRPRLPQSESEASDMRYILSIQSPLGQDLSTTESKARSSQWRLQGDLLGVPEIRVLAPSLERGLDSEGGSGLEPPSVEEMDQQELSPSDQPPIVRLFLALWFAIISHSELVCYFVVFLQQVKSPTILSLPLPLMVFLWGTLSVPRPTKTFWVTLIAYTEVIVVLKCMFQFELLPWNQQAVPDNAPFFPPRILGIERKSHYAVYDLLLLLVAFFHRFMLKSLGLWKSSYQDTEEFVKGEEVYELLEDEDSQSVDQRKTASERSGSTADDRSIHSQMRPRDGMGSFRRRRSTNYDIMTTGGRKLAFSRGFPDEVIPREAGSRRATLIVVKTEDAEPFQHIPQVMLEAGKRYVNAVQDFFHQLLHPSLQVTADVYAYMFMCDFFNFIIVIMGFASFGTQQGDGGVSSYLQENKVPVPFLVMMILQFALIIIDRSLFLRKFILGKIIFQFFLVIGVHIWMFFVLPAVTERPFNASLPPQMWYMVKCFYLLLSAYQIRSGYPTRILRNFLCKKYNIINLCLFKLFMVTPFLFELRALMDWVWTDTSMTLFDWLKMEDIFANIFELKCGRRMESEYPQPRGQKKSPTTKYLMGGGFLFLIIAIIWFPLVFFALGNTVGEPSVPYEFTLEVRIGAYQPIFKMSAGNSTIHRLQEKEYMQIVNIYKKDRSAQTFLSAYNYDDIAVAVLNRNSTSVWGISPPDQQRLIDEVSEERDIVIKLLWTVKRNTNDPSTSGIITDSKDWVIQGRVNNVRNPELDKLLKLLKGDKGENYVVLHDVLPKFLKVTNRETATPVTQFMYGNEDERSYRTVFMNLYHGQFTDLQSTQQWWEMTENCSDINHKLYLQYLPYSDCDSLVIYTFNDKVFPRTLSFLSAGGIIGLYTTMVLVAGRVIRGFISGASYKIMFTELPNVDRVLQLCHDIYLVRESGELALEEDLFAKLVFLYRSPETLIKWTRPREEGELEGDEAGDVRSAAMQ